MVDWRRARERALQLWHDGRLDTCEITERLRIEGFEVWECDVYNMVLVGRAAPNRQSKGAA